MTDQDLESLVDWVQGHLNLTRFRDGWGVAQGLDVYCDPRNAARVLVGPGYAMDRCGQDIIVCDEVGVDLSDVCRNQIPDDGIYLVDLYISYGEKTFNAQPIYNGNACRSSLPCQNTRVQEGFVLNWKQASAGSDFMQDEAQEWHKKYDKCLTVLRKFQEAFPDGGVYDAARTKKVGDWLGNWITNHPPRQFQFVKTLIDNKDYLSQEKNRTELLFWIIQDCRNRFLNATPKCEAATGVPLARIALHRQDTNSCKVEWIDIASPYRRPLSPFQLPAPLGKVNLGHIIWQHREGIAALLSQWKITVNQTSVNPWPQTVKALKRLLEIPREEVDGNEKFETPLCVSPGTQIEVQYHKFLGARHQDWGDHIILLKLAPVAPITPITPVAPVAPVAPTTPVATAPAAGATRGRRSTA
ncbi:MAG TPA: hypothetical protein VGB67_16865 [Fibrella sp.]